MEDIGSTTFGVRGQIEYVRPYGDTQVLPIYETLFLGGEYSVRGFDIRSIGPRDLRTGLVLGGNKSLLFNAGDMITIAGPALPDPVLRRGPGPNPRSILRDVGGRGQRHPATDAGLRATRSPPGSSPIRTPLVRPPRLSASGGVQDLHGRGDPVLHARAQRAVPVDLRAPAASRDLQEQLQPAQFFQFRFAVG